MPVDGFPDYVTNTQETIDFLLGTSEIAKSKLYEKNPPFVQPLPEIKLIDTVLEPGFSGSDTSIVIKRLFEVKQRKAGSSYVNVRRYGITQRVFHPNEITSVSDDKARLEKFLGNPSKQEGPVFVEEADWSYEYQPNPSDKSIANMSMNEWSMTAKKLQAQKNAAGDNRKIYEESYWKFVNATNEDDALYWKNQMLSKVSMDLEPAGNDWGSWVADPVKAIEVRSSFLQKHHKNIVRTSIVWGVSVGIFAILQLILLVAELTGEQD